jgi:probable addiction module antidote protein
MAKTLTIPWDPADHLHTEQDMADYREAALEDGDPTLVAAALGDIARAKGMTQVAREAGLGRESLYKTHSCRQSRVRHHPQSYSCTGSPVTRIASGRKGRGLRASHQGRACR